MSQQTITVIPGDGIGPEIMDATIKILDKLECGLQYDIVDAGPAALEKGKELIPEETLTSIETNKVALKGPISTPSGGGFRSINVTLRQKYQLYANVRPVLTIPGTKSRFEDIDILTFRENTQGMYGGEGQIREGNRAEAKSVMTKEGCERIIRYAYEQAVKLGRKKVTVVHKANIIKTTSGMFLETAREIAPEFPSIESEEMIVDATCMNLVMWPEKFDTIVTSNLFGDIVSDLCAGLVGGLGMAPGANIGKDIAIFEAVHGSAPDIAGQNKANPTSILLAAAMMLDHLNMSEKANALRKAIVDTVAAGDRTTGDLGGSGSTSLFTEALLERL